MKVACLVVLLAAAALGQKRPDIPVNFFAQVGVNSYAHGETLFGEGVWAVAFNERKAVEHYLLRQEGHILPFVQFELERFDLGQAYFINSEDRSTCVERQINSTMLAPFSWVKDAKYIGEDVYHHRALQLWAADFGSVTFELGVFQGYESTPVIYRRRSHSGDFEVEFQEFNANNTIPADLFDVPNECKKGPVAKPLRQAPNAVRPNPAENFYTETRVESRQNGRTLFGEGFQGVSHSQNKAIDSSYIREEGHIIPVHVFRLDRFDLGKIYEIDSEDPAVCRERQVTGALPSSWAWLKNATYAGRDEYHHTEVDVWRLNLDRVELELGTLAPDNNLPVFYKELTPEGEVFVEFRDFTSNATINPETFNVPGECQTAAAAQQ